MWNYDFILPSLLVMLILLIYYFLRPRLPIRMNDSFLGLLLTDSFTILFDFLSTHADEAHTSCSIGMLYFLNMGFFVFYLARIYWFFRFTLNVMNFHGGAHPQVRRWMPAMLALSEVITFSSPLTHAVFSIDAKGYHSGPLYRILYVCFFFYITASVVALMTHRKRMSTYDFASLMGVQFILLMGNVARLLLPQVLVMNVFCLLSILIIYLSFENPDLYLSHQGSAFNARAFRDLLNEWSENDQPYQLLGMILCDYSDKRSIYGGFQMDRTVTLISRYLTAAYPEALVFYLRNGCFGLLGPMEMDFDSIRERLRERFCQPWRTEDTDLNLSVGFVHTDFQEIEGTVDRQIGTFLIALANAGKSGAVEQEVSVSKTLQVINAELEAKRVLERALEQDRVEVFLQPLFDSRTRKLVAAEALARIRDEEGNILSPCVFIPLAEKNGRINQLGEQVFRKTCQFIRDHDLEELGMSWINVNLSPIQCMNRNLAQSFAAILREYGVPANHIHLEITEESMIDYTLLRGQVEALQGAGFEFALDDYGSGYSNLIRVRQYPFRHIKIDMAVVKDYFRERDLLLPAIIQVFRQMDYTITAEGIETQQMAQALTDIGCDYLQGFYFSKPIPFEEFLKKYRPHAGASETGGQR